MLEIPKQVLSILEKEMIKIATKIIPTGIQPTGLDPKCYPTMSDLLEVINDELNKPTDKSFDKVQIGLDLERRKPCLF